MKYKFFFLVLFFFLYPIYISANLEREKSTPLFDQNQTDNLQIYDEQNRVQTYSDYPLSNQNLIPSDDMSDYAAENQIPTTPDPSSEVDSEDPQDYESLLPSGYQMFVFILKIILFVIVLLIVSVIIKKFYGKKTVISNISQVVDVLGVRPITHNKFLYLVQFGSRFILLAISDSNIHKVSEIINKEEVDNIKLLLNINSNEEEFEDVLQREYNGKDDKVSKFKKQLKDIINRSK